jgi:MFS transporter, DHA1 family, inner membrane transport protein
MHAILAIALGAFAVGTTEFVVVGLLPTIATDLGVAASTAGLLVTGYAIGLAIGGPVLAYLTRRLPRRTVLIGLMVAFALAHVGMAFAPTFAVLLAVRILTASAHGAFFAVGAIVAAEHARPGEEGRAIGSMFTGLTVATVVGVPAGTLIGQASTWRVPFVLVAVLAITAAAAIWRVVERDGRITDARGGISVDRPALGLALLTTVIGFGSQFVLFTFLALFLTTRTGLASAWISPLLLVFGVASALGTTLGGRAADRWPAALLPAALATLASVLAAIGLFGTQPGLVLPLLFAWGIAGFTLSPALQARVVAAAGPENTLASALNISAFNVGIASGSFIGTTVVRMSQLASAPLIAAALTALALVPAVVGSIEWLRRQRPASTPTVTTAATGGGD